MTSSEAQLERNLFRGYVAAPGSYDELLIGPMRLRASWQRFSDAATELEIAEFSRRWEQAQRQLAQNSLAYQDPHEPRVRTRPWALDAFPLVIAAEEWRALSTAIEQRASLLELMIRDLLGPQQLLQDGALPLEAVYAHPGFQMAYCGQSPPLGRFLHFYAVDLARSPDGRWWVLDDRTEAPSGAGFALENRMASSRMLPDVIRPCEVERLAPYFVAARRQLARLAPADRDEPRIVLLTQSAGSPNYFEDAYLARYLGYTLAEAGDLAVRGNRVFLKTLGGLSPVDVLLRRPTSEDCDPLELSATSAAGIAGLMQAARSGNVGVANVIGSGLVESPIFMAFMPEICQTLLGEPLQMPGVATWWCGNRESRAYVVKRIDELQIKPAFRRRTRDSLDAKQLSQLAREELVRRIEAEPFAYVAQEKIVRSGAPTWNRGRVESAFIALRAFAVADGDRYEVMNGGLTRVSKTLAPLEFSLLDGEQSKDTWVLADGPVQPVTLLPTGDEVVPLRRGGAELPSRVAENVYWLGRQTERAEALARLLRTATLRLASEELVTQIPELPPLLRMLAIKGQIEPGFVVEEIKTQLPAIEQLLPTVVFDDLQPGALRATVSNIASLAANVRDRISLDSWRIIRQMDEHFWPARAVADLPGMLEKLDSVLVSLAAFTGLVVESMTRTPAWRFLELGRRLERALQTTGLVQNMLHGRGAHNQPALEATLEVADSLMTYRSRYLARLQLAPVLDLLVTDNTNPRSIAFQLDAIAIHVERIVSESSSPSDTEELQLATSLLAAVRDADAQRLATDYLAGHRASLEQLLNMIEATLPDLSHAISHRYLVHAGPTHRLAEIDPA